MVIHLGADIINDISGGNLDEKMIATVAKLQTPYILMHMPANYAKSTILHKCCNRSA